MARSVEYAGHVEVPFSRVPSVNRLSDPGTPSSAYRRSFPRKLTSRYIKATSVLYSALPVNTTALGDGGSSWPSRADISSKVCQI
jgi:hypothetical protein